MKKREPNQEKCTKAKNQTINTMYKKISLKKDASKLLKNNKNLNNKTLKKIHKL